jgi:fatty acid desaturase
VRKGRKRTMTAQKVAISMFLAIFIAIWTMVFLSALISGHVSFNGLRATLITLTWVAPYLLCFPLFRYLKRK